MSSRFVLLWMSVLSVACGSVDNPSHEEGDRSEGAATATTPPAPAGTSSSPAGASSSPAGASSSPAATDRGFPPNSAPWVSFYGPATGVNLAKTAATFRVINIDADPDAGNFTIAQIASLKNNGQNRVISYLNIGSCETYRSYWNKCVATGALTTVYSPEYPDEKWANLGNVAYQNLILDTVAPALAARGVDGFFLDNMEVVEHGANATSGPCNAACAQGGLDLIYKLRQKFPKMLIVMQNATSDVTRLGKTNGVDYWTLLDGISHEETYGDPQALAEMKKWKNMQLTVGAGRPLWLAIEDYVGACASSKKPAANQIYAKAAADGLVAYVTDESGAQQKPCFWADL